MGEENKKQAKQLLGRTVVSKTGKRFGIVGNISFDVSSGELIHLILKNPTGFTEGLELERDKVGNLLLPFSSVVAIGDFVVVSEEDII